MEGPYWLVRLLGPAFPAPSALIHSGSEFEEQRNLRQTATGPAAEARRQGVGGLSFFSEDMHNAVEAACKDAVEEQNALVEPDRFSASGQLLNPAPGIEYDVDDMQD